MNTNLHRSKPALEEVLNEIASARAAPDARQVRTWVEKFPEYKKEITDFTTAWIEMQVACDGDDVETEEIDSIVNRTMSCIQIMLHEHESHSDPIKSMLTQIHTANYDLDSFEKAIGVDRSILSCLMERLIEPATIPGQLVSRIADALRRPAGLIRAYLQQPSAPVAVFKARTRPRTCRATFADVVRGSSLTDAEKARWLAEPPDPAMQG